MTPFAWSYNELAKSLLIHYVTGVKVVSNPGSLEQGLIDLTTQPSPSVAQYLKHWKPTFRESGNWLAPFLFRTYSN